MEQFMFNETLYKEIIRTTMLTCIDVRSHEELYIKLLWTFRDISIIMTHNGVDMSVSDAWRRLADTIKYGSEGDANDVSYDISDIKEADALQNGRAGHFGAHPHSDPGKHAHLLTRLNHILAE